MPSFNKVPIKRVNIEHLHTTGFFTGIYEICYSKIDLALWTIVLSPIRCPLYTRILEVICEYELEMP